MMKTESHNPIDETIVLNPQDGSSTQRRGMAIMLVLISIAAVTIMTAAYVTSRYTAPQVSRNIVSGSSARSSAEAGLSMANALLECQGSDWRNRHVNGVLFQDLPVGNGTVTVSVTDRAGNLPTSETEYAIIKAQGLQDGMLQVAEANAYSPMERKEIDLTFSEFAVFGVKQVTIRNSLIARWSLSPAAGLGAPVWLGTSATKASMVCLKGTSRVLDGRLLAPSDIAASIVRDDAVDPSRLTVSSPAGSTRLPIPMAPLIDTSNLNKASFYGLPKKIVLDGWTLSTDRSMIFDSYTIKNNATLRINSSSGVTTRVVKGDLLIDNNSVLIVETDQDLIIKGNLTILNGSGINVLDGVRCRILVGGDLKVEQSALGVSRAKAAQVTDPKTGLMQYKFPGDCQVYQISGTGFHTWDIDLASVVCARIYAPESQVRVRGMSTYMGSIVGEKVVLNGNSVLYYDPRLNKGKGYTNSKSEVYDANGALNTTLLASMTDLSDSTIDVVNAQLNGIIEPPVIVPPSEPTPRTKWVKWRMKRLGIKTVKDHKDHAGDEGDGKYGGG